MNTIFCTLIILSMLALAASEPTSLFPAMIDGVSDGIVLIIRLAAIYSVWLSVLKIMERTELDKKLCRVLKPVVKRLFKGESDKAYALISVNIASNMLGMGGAATPAGIMAMNEMYKGDNKASDNMLLLLVINATSVQLIPATVIALRATAGSQNASDIFFPTLIATVVSTLTGVLLCKLFKKRKNAVRTPNNAPNSPISSPKIQTYPSIKNPLLSTLKSLFGRKATDKATGKAAPNSFANSTKK